MKTKLTLTIRKEIIEKAKQKAKARGVSVSKLFEETFEEKGSKKSSSQIAGEKLLDFLKTQPATTVTGKSDKELIIKGLKEKYG